MDDREIATLLRLAASVFISAMAVAFVDNILLFIGQRQDAPTYFVLFVIVLLMIYLIVGHESSGKDS